MRSKISKEVRPVNFSPEDEYYFAEDSKLPKAAQTVKKYENVMLSPEGIIFYKNKILDESFSFPANFKSWKKRSIVKSYVENYLLRKSTRRDHVLWITDDWSSGYFHWLADCLPKLSIAGKYADSGLLLLPNRLKNLDFVSSSLEMSGVRDFDFIDEKETVKAGVIYLPTLGIDSGQFDPVSIRAVREKFQNQSAPPARGNFERIYISRKKAAKRRVDNEDQLLPILKKYDFKIIYAEDYCFREQVEMFSSARYFVSIHGAGLTNMLFMPENSKVLELRKKDKTLTNCYYNMSNSLGLDYFYQFCKPSGSDKDPHTADLTVDPDRFADNLKMMFQDSI